jgi:hypothetical protein
VNAIVKAMDFKVHTIWYYTRIYWINSGSSGFWLHKSGWTIQGGNPFFIAKLMPAIFRRLPRIKNYKTYCLT